MSRIISKISRLFTDTDYRNIIFAEKGFYNWMNDEQYIKMIFKARMGYPLNLDDPKTFNEKLQWLKLHDHNPLYPKLVDKYEVKKYVANLIGDQYIIPTLEVWDAFEDIDFDSLPDQFVLKCTHDSGGLVICKDKTKFNYNVAKRKIEKSMKRNYFYHGREWPYKHVKPRILAEKYMQDGKNEINDYKIHNFPSGPKVILVCRDRFKESGLTEDFYREDWEHLDIKRENHPNSNERTEKPEKLQEMLKLSDRLAEDMSFLRTDFYTIEDRIYFGELTFYPASGFSQFIPNEWDMTFGQWIRIPDLCGGGYLIKSDGFCLWLHEQDNKLIEPDFGNLTDYKFFCFDGYVDCVMVCLDRQSGDPKFYFFDENWNLLRYNIRGKEAPENFTLPKPECMDEMFMIAGRLSRDKPFSRIDLYNSKGRVYFGEITFYPESGCDKNILQDADMYWGNMIQLNGGEAK